MPHLAARALLDTQELEMWLETMRSSGVNHVLLLAGDNDEPAGIFSSSLDVLLTGLLQKHGIQQVDVVAHPEGSSRMRDPGNPLPSTSPRVNARDSLPPSSLRSSLSTSFRPA